MKGILQKCCAFKEILVPKKQIHWVLSTNFTLRMRQWVMRCEFPFHTPHFRILVVCLPFFPKNTAHGNSYILFCELACCALHIRYAIMASSIGTTRECTLGILSCWFSNSWLPFLLPNAPCRLQHGIIWHIWVVILHLVSWRLFVAAHHMEPFPQIQRMNSSHVATTMISIIRGEKHSIWRSFGAAIPWCMHHIKQNSGRKGWVKCIVAFKEYSCINGTLLLRFPARNSGIGIQVSSNNLTIVLSKGIVPQQILICNICKL